MKKRIAQDDVWMFSVSEEIDVDSKLLFDDFASNHDLRDLI